MKDENMSSEEDNTDGDTDKKSDDNKAEKLSNKSKITSDDTTKAPLFSITNNVAEKDDSVAEKTEKQVKETKNIDLDNSYSESLDHESKPSLTSDLIHTSDEKPLTIPTDERSVS